MITAAHREAVQRYLNWDVVADRLDRYEALGRAFDLEGLRSGSSRSPYYCHYMAWRLSTWHDESLFLRLDQLLATAERIPNWRFERSLLQSNEYSDFWSLVWQLQMVEYLESVGEQVSWGRDGPDLSVEIEGEKWFVECYCFRKSFGLLNYLEDLLQAIDPEVRVHYDKCKKFSLPLDAQRDTFLSKVVQPFLDESFLIEARKRAALEYPQVLFEDECSSLIIYIDGGCDSDYVPLRIPSDTGSPSGYLAVALQEAANAKRNANHLTQHRPNLVAVNFLLSADYQLASFTPREYADPIPELADHIDGLAVGVFGIDQRIDHRALKIINGTHETLGVFGVETDAA